MMNLIFKGSRFSFYMMMIVAIPLLIETESILNIWLKDYPAHTINFVRLILLMSLSESLSGTLITAMLATGNIKKYQIIVGGLQILNFPLSYIFLKLGFFPETTLIISIIISQISLFSRLILLRDMIRLSVITFFNTDRKSVV